MAKRFIDTGLFDDDWFMDLSKDAKILWIYFLTKCDHAGMLKLNARLCEVQTGIKDLNGIIKLLGNRIITVSERLYFIPKFLQYQYPGFPYSKAKAQLSAIEILTKYGLFEDGKLTVGELLRNSYSNNNNNGNGESEDESPENKDRLIIPPTFEMVDRYCKKRNNGIDPQYFIDKNTAAGWTYGKNKTRLVDWQAHIRTWEKNKKDWEQEKNPTPIIPHFSSGPDK
jgi:hypothetical protein